MRTEGGGTAEGTALYRHLLGDDPYALRFVGPWWMRRMGTWRLGERLGFDPDAILGRTPSAIVARHKEMDARLQDALRAGVTQVVLIGAGFDARPWRLEVGQARWFLVDHPGTARMRAERAGDLPPVGERVDVDLAQHPLGPALAQTSFDPGQPTLWVIEGLAPYLSEADNAGLLRTLADTSAPGSRVLLDIWLRRAPGSLYTRPVIELPARLLIEPIRWPTTLTRADALLSEAGWRLEDSRAANEVPGFPQAYAGMVVLEARR